MPSAVQFQAKVIYDFAAQGESEISVSTGQIVDVLDASDADWMLVVANGQQGFIPVAYAQKIAPKARPQAAVVPKITSFKNFIADANDAAGQSSPQKQSTATAAASSSSWANVARHSVTITQPLAISSTEILSPRSQKQTDHSDDTQQKRTPVKAAQAETTAAAQQTGATAASTDNSQTIRAGKSVRNMWESVIAERQSQQQNSPLPKSHTMGPVRKGTASATSTSSFAALKQQMAEQLTAQPNTSSREGAMSPPSVVSPRQDTPPVGAKPSQRTAAALDAPAVVVAPAPSSSTQSIQTIASDDRKPAASAGSTAGISKLKQLLEQSGGINPLAMGAMGAVRRKQSNAADISQSAAATTTAGASPQPVILEEPKSAGSALGFASPPPVITPLSPADSSESSLQSSSVVGAPLTARNYAKPLPTLPGGGGGTIPRSFSTKSLPLVPRSVAASRILLQVKSFMRWRRLRTFLQKDSSLKDARLRRQFVAEMLATEQSYERGLATAIDLFLIPLRNQKILNPQEIMGLFSSIEQVRSVVSEVLKQLTAQFAKAEADNVSPRYGLVFRSMAPFFKIYIDYVNTYDDAMILYAKLQKSNKQFAKFLQQQMASPQCAGLDLPAYLITPVQRLPRYRLLLNDILQRTPQNHVDFKDLSFAVDAVAETAKLINQRKRENETTAKLSQLSPLLQKMVKDIIQPHRRLMNISEALVSINERGGNNGAAYQVVFEEMPADIFLFSDCLFITLNRENQLHCFSMYLAFSQLDETEPQQAIPSPGTPLNDSSSSADAQNDLPAPIRIVAIVSGRRIEATIRIQNHDQRKQWFILIRENAEQSKKHAISKILASDTPYSDGQSGSFSVTQLLQIEERRFELGRQLPVVKQELENTKQTLDKMHIRRHKVARNLENNKAKLAELMKLIAENEEELVQLDQKDAEGKLIEQKQAAKVEDLREQIEDCDKILLNCVKQDPVTYVHIYGPNAGNVSAPAAESQFPRIASESMLTK